MATISIGITTTGTTIRVEINAENEPKAGAVFAAFSDREAFEALLAIEYLMPGELRRQSLDGKWLFSLRQVQNYLTRLLGPDKFVSLMSSLAIDSAFAARDFGKHRVYEHFRSL